MYGEREGVRWGGGGGGCIPSMHVEVRRQLVGIASPLLCAFLVLNSGHQACWQVGAFANRAISPTLNLLRVVPHYIIL